MLRMTAKRNQIQRDSGELNDTNVRVGIKKLDQERELEDVISNIVDLLIFNIRTDFRRYTAFALDYIHSQRGKTGH